MSKLLTLCLIIVGLINFAPIAGLLGAKALESAYNIELDSDDVVILMRHRALLFGLLGGFILYAAFVPIYQTVAMILAGISMVGFAILFHFTGTENPFMHKVLIADYVGIVVLVIGAVLKVLTKNG